MSNFQAPGIGRIVHYTIGHDSNGKPISRPAIVVYAWSAQDPFYVNLQVFLDGSNDSEHHLAKSEPWSKASDAEIAKGLMWRTSVPYDENGHIGSWQWPHRMP